jgi:phosphoribosylanthranilate isomerase
MSSGRLRIKVCGMRDGLNIAEAATLPIDYMGFIFFRNSKRYVGDGFEIPKDFPSRIKRVGVFVNDSVEVISGLARKHSLDFIQLHGGESVSQCAELRENGFKVIKAFGLESGTDFENLIPFKNEVDFFLFDTKGKEFGGTGKTFDWDILARYDQDVPFFLSGGLAPENVAGVKALGKMNIHGLDVNSGVEITPGLKDVGRLKIFIERVRG